MKSLITGAKGCVGKNLTAALADFHELLPYDVDVDPTVLITYAGQADFVIHLAGINRAQEPQALWDGNVGFTERLLTILKEQGNTCPILFASSVQATLEGQKLQDPHHAGCARRCRLHDRYNDEHYRCHHAKHGRCRYRLRHGDDDDQGDGF